MDEMTSTPEQSQQDVAETRKAAVKEFYEAATKDARAAVLKKYPFLAEVFAAGNYS